jgi:hypothetical protein
MSTEEVLERGRKRWTRRREDVGGLPRQQLYSRRAGYVCFEKPAAKTTGERDDQDQADTSELCTDEGDPHREITSWQPAWVPCCG